MRMIKVCFLFIQGVSKLMPYCSKRGPGDLDIIGHNSSTTFQPFLHRVVTPQLTSSVNSLMSDMKVSYSPDIVFVTSPFTSLLVITAVSNKVATAGGGCRITSNLILNPVITFWKNSAPKQSIRTSLIH